MSQLKLLSGSRNASFWLALALASALASGADARTRLTPSVTVSEGYDDNAAATNRNEKGSFVTRTQPKLVLKRDAEFGEASIEGGATSRIYSSLHDLDAIDAYGAYGFEQKMSPRLRFYSDGRYERFQKRDIVFDAGEAIASGRPDLTRTDVSGRVQYMLDPTLFANLSGGVSQSRYDNVPTLVARRDSDSAFGQLSVQQNLTSMDSVSGSVSYSRTNLSDIGTGKIDSNIWTYRAHWNRAWSASLSSSMSIGMRFLENNFSGGTDKSTGLVGGLSLTRQTPRSLAQISYNRESRGSSGGSSPVDVDTVEALYQYRLSERVNLALRGSYNSFRSSAKTCLQSFGPFCVLIGNDAVDTDTLRAGARVEWRVRRRLSTFASIDWTDHNASGVTVASGEFNKVLTMVGFRYHYDVEF